VKTFDVAIVGGGLIGVSAAMELRRRNLRVVVFDRQQPGREASWAAAGMLAPGDDPQSAPLTPLAKKSLDLYPEFVRGIEEASGHSVGFAQQGTFQLFFEDGEPARDAFIERHRQFGLSAEGVSIRVAREREPQLGTQAVAAAWLSGEASIDPRSLVDAALSAAETAGAEVRSGCEVTGVLREGRRCRGVVTREGTIPARHVVVAAGCFSSLVPGEIGRYAPVRPVRGQMLSLRRRGVKVGHVLRSDRGYLVPRADGRIVAGSTLEDAGFEKIVTPAGVGKIVEAATELVPALADAEIVETWAGLRPGSPDALPILGPTAVEGLIVATGHYRDGILLAPITAKLVAGWVCGDAEDLDAQKFSPLRFEEGAISTGRTV
jgi:glycine oxidase